MRFSIFTVAFFLSGIGGFCSANVSPDFDISAEILASEPPESQCGPTWDVQDVESYINTTGTTKDFVERRERAVGYHVRPGCSGTLISKDLFLSAGHCNYQVGDIVRFNYQRAPDLILRTPSDYTVAEVVEQEASGGWDYAIVRLSGNPGLEWGFTSITESEPVTATRVTIIQHPARVPKVIHAGAVSSVAAIGYNWFTHEVDTVGGSSGSGVLNEDGLLVGVHTHAGCSTGNPVYGNNAIRMSRLIERSPTLRALNATTIKQVSSGMCIHPGGGAAFPTNGTLAVLWDSCSEENRLKFELTKDGAIRHANTGKCLHPNGGSSNPLNGTTLVFDDGCDEARLQFNLTSSGSLKHKTSGKCVHPSGGSSTPVNGTALVLHDGCDEDRLSFSASNLPEGRISHVSGLCIHPQGGSATPTANTNAILERGCDAEGRLTFNHASNGNLVHKTGGYCLAPLGGSLNPSNSTPIVFSASCGTATAEFKVLPNGSLQHKASGKCVHPYLGWAFPSVATQLVLHEGCGGERLKFFSVTN